MPLLLHSPAKTHTRTHCLSHTHNTHVVCRAESHLKHPSSCFGWYFFSFLKGWLDPRPCLRSHIPARSGFRRWFLAGGDRLCASSPLSSCEEEVDCTGGEAAMEHAGLGRCREGEGRTWRRTAPPCAGPRYCNLQRETVHD